MSGEGARRFLREQSLSAFFLAIFLAAVVGQAIAGHELYNQEQATHGEPAISFWRYLVSSQFGQAVMENWQSEFLAIGSFVVLTIFLRQRGSPESKPVGAPHRATGVEG
jgi:hypothetical protein